MSLRPDPEAIGAQIEQLLQEMHGLGDPRIGERAQELVRLLMSLYGAGLGRMLDVVRTERGGPQAVLDRFAADGLIASLLVLHELHPQPLEVRVRAAIEALQPHLPAAMALVLTGIEADVVRLRLAAGAGGAGSAANLRASVERAVQEAAPEVARIEIDGLEDARLIQITRRSAPGEGAGPS